TGSTITFDTHLKGVIRLVRGISIDKNLSIHGPGVDSLSISGSGGLNVLLVEPDASVTIFGLAFRGTNQEQKSSGIIINDGTLTSSTISGDTATDGPGGGIENFGPLKILNSRIIGNTAIYGAGISNYGVPLTLTNSIVSGNHAPGQGYGGGILNLGGGSLTLTNSTVSSNTAGYG